MPSEEANIILVPSSSSKNQQTSSAVRNEKENKPKIKRRKNFFLCFMVTKSTLEKYTCAKFAKNHS